MKIVVFAGGVGTRLWPLSRKNTPKQFGKIVGEKSTLQETVDRLLPEFAVSDIYIATGSKYRDTVMSQLPMLPQENFFFEPVMRDVGPAIGLVSFLLDKRFSNEPVAILWSDHLVKNIDEFRKALRMAESEVVSGQSKFVFIGQKPRFANQNCGWIELGEKLGSEGQEEIHKFKRLCYRPKLEEAEQFFTDANYVWNLGYFVTTPEFLVNLFKTYVPDMYEKLERVKESFDTERFESVIEEIYPTLEKISFDDAILVKLSPDNLTVISTDLGWSDVGAWDALKEALTETDEENVTLGNVMLEDSRDSLVFNYSDKLLVGIDLSEMIIVETEDVVLVCPKSSVPKVKKFVEGLSGTPHEHLA